MKNFLEAVAITFITIVLLTIFVGLLEDAEMSLEFKMKSKRINKRIKIEMNRRSIWNLK